MQLQPEPGEAVVVAPATERARTVTRGEGRRLVEEEQLGEPPWLQQPRPPPAAKLQLAGDPSLPVVPTSDPPGVVVQATTVAVDETAGRIGDQLALRRDPVLQCHQVSAPMRE